MSTLNDNIMQVQTQVLRSYDSEELNDVVKGASFDIQQLDKGAFHAELLSTPLGKGRLDKGYYSRSILTVGTFPEEYMTFGFIHDTPKEGSLNGGIMAKHDLLLSVENAPVNYATANHTYWSGFQFRREDILKTGMQLPENDNTIYHLEDQVKKRLALQINAAFEYLGETDDTLKTFINTDIMYNHILNLYVKALNQSVTVTHLKHNDSILMAKKIYHYIHENAAEPIQMIHLTQLIGKSERTVERVFKKHFGISPYSYIKVHRLHLVRDKLLERDSSTLNIMHLAMENGFIHMGYFGDEYKKLFNETPSETLHKQC